VTAAGGVGSPDQRCIQLFSLRRPRTTGGPVHVLGRWCSPRVPGRHKGGTDVRKISPRSKPIRVPRDVTPSRTTFSSQGSVLCLRRVGVVLIRGGAPGFEGHGGLWEFVWSSWVRRGVRGAPSEGGSWGLVGQIDRYDINADARGAARNGRDHNPSLFWRRVRGFPLALVGQDCRTPECQG